jgi:hypothetical protein
MSEEVPVPAPIPPGLPAPRTQWFGLSTPIGVFGAIMALVEIAFVISAAFVNDIPLQWALFLVGAVGFFGNAVVFYRLLHNKPWVLYPPWSYGGTTTIGTYREVIEAYEAATHRTAVLAQQSTRVIAATVEPMSTKPDVQVAGTVIPPEDRDHPMEDQATLEGKETVRVEKFNDGQYLTLVVGDEHRGVPYFPIDESQKRGIETKRISYDHLQWIGQFIISASEAYQELGYFSTPESYGLTWVMRDRKSGETLLDIGFVRDLGYGIAHVDRRRLSETEVLPGMELEPVALPPPGPPLPFPATSPDMFFGMPATSPGESTRYGVARRRRRSHAPRLDKPPATRPPGT